MIKAIKGTNDILPVDINKWYYLENIVKNIFAEFNYSEIRTPVFEETALFKRGIGEQTDIVSKEMYTFTDRSETSISLKPEMTAPVVRAFIEHSLGKIQQLNKLFYISPMFRQERPQAGRLRQFHQFGAEALGSDSPLLDAEMILIAYAILKKAGVKNLSVTINSLGKPESREAYKKELRTYLEDHKSYLSEDSQKRLDTNVLRIFDSKNETDISIMNEAPLLIDYLDDASKDHFETVKHILNSANVPYEIEPKLVRGLDYYTETTFEISSESVGSQSALCGGGRYDGLAEQIGGKPAPGVGFAAGIERILLALENENEVSFGENEIDVYVTRIDKSLQHESYAITNTLRSEGYTVEVDYLQRSVKAQMREANKLNAKFVLMIGGEEYERDAATLKRMSDGEQKEVSLDNIQNAINDFGE